MMFRPKCPYCRGKNIYLKSANLVEIYGCKDCEKKVKYLKNKGLTRREIERVIKGF